MLLLNLRDKIKINLRAFISNILFVIVIIGVIILGTYNVKDLKEARKAEETLKNLIELRSALEKYYKLTNHYPNLTKMGVKDNLKLLDYTDENGNLISFAEIYGHTSIAKTVGTENLLESNEVYDISDFSKGTESGGWNFNFSGNTGEIHANLPKNTYSQGINWYEY